MNCSENDNNKTVEVIDFNCSFLESLPTSIKNIISWRCPAVTGSVIVAIIALSIMIKTMSFISVIAYLGLFFILSSLVLRFYTNFINNEASNPLESLLDKDVKQYLTKISDCVQQQTSDDESQLNRVIAYLREIFVLSSYVDAVKFFFTNLALIYVGMCFNLIDLVMLTSVTVLVGPKIYCVYRTQIDDFVMKMKDHASNTLMILKDKMATLPIIGGKLKTI